MLKKSKLLLFIIFLSLTISVSGQKNKNMALHKTKVILMGITGKDSSVLANNTKLFLDEINRAYVSKNQPDFDISLADGNVKKVVGDLWAVSPFLVVNTELITNVLSTEYGKYEIRSIQLIFDKAEKEYSQQEGVITFNTEGKIIDFKIGLAPHYVIQVLNEADSVSDLRKRKIIINFVEDFRTAYNIKDTSYLSKVLSDKALIITGKVINKTKENELKPKVTYTRQSKQKYLENLDRIFKKARMINVNFDSIKVVKHNKYPDRIYGVHLYQTWDTSYLNDGGYKDVGYLFLIIDFENEDNPKIWVRTWSPEDFFSFNRFTITI